MYRICKLMFTLAICIALCSWMHKTEGQVLSVTITVDPPAPPYQAATWIRFTCSAPTALLSTLVEYNWTVYCTYNQPPGQRQLIGSLPFSASLLLRSTADICIDTVVCTARDLITNNIGEASWTLGTVTGIGLWGDQPIENNAAFEADAFGKIGRIYCHSSSNQENVGQWYGPNGADITHNILDIFGIQFFNGQGHPSYSSIEVIGGHQFTSSQQGTYTCVAPDNNGVEQMATVWIFPYNLPRSLVVSFAGRKTLSPFTLSCDTNGLPATIVAWTRSSIDLTTGGIYNISQTHSSNYSANFENNLVIDQALHQVNDIYACFVVSVVHKPDNRHQQEVFRATNFLGVYSIGSTASVTCSSREPGAALIQWETSGGSLVSNTSRFDVPVTDSIHHSTYHCRVYNISGHLITDALLFKFIVNVPDTVLLAVTATTNPSPTLGTSYTLKCQAAITAGSGVFSHRPVPSFHYENGSTINSRTGVAVTSPRSVTSSVQEVQLTFNSLKTSHAGGYICRAILNSPALDSPLVKEDDLFLLNLKLSPPLTVQLSVSHSSPYYAGSSVTLTCEALASFFIDTEISVNVTWKRNGVRLLGDHVTVTTVGLTTRSMLTLSQLHYEQDNGHYQCSVLFEPSGLDDYLTASEAVNSGLLEINIQVQPLQVVITPPDLTVLDLSPDNVVSFSCSATDLDDTTLGRKTFTWRRRVSGSSTSSELHHNSGSVSIANSNLDEIVSSSMLVTSEETEGSYEYICESTQMSTDGSTVIATGNASAIVIVKGPANPVQPTNVSASTLSFSTARIVWRVPSIAYTQETHTVVFGIHPSSLNMTSSSVTGVSDLTAVNRLYSVTLSMLREGATYFYRVRSMNTVGRVTESEIQSFTIDESPIFSALYVSNPSSSPTAGHNLTLVCEAIVHNSTTGPPSITWWDAQGVLVFSNQESGIFLSTSQWNGTHIVSLLAFQPLRVSQSQEYTCRIEFTAIGVVKSHSYVIQVIAKVIPVRIRASTDNFKVLYPLTLTCEVDTNDTSPSFTLPIGATSYTWSSDCVGSCYVREQTGQLVSTQALRAKDSGSYTCLVVDSVGNAGNTSIDITVTGVGLFSDRVGTLSNNSYIVVGNDGLGTMHCVSGSIQPHVGQWIAPNGKDFTTPGSHPFNVVQGGIGNPGSLEISLIPGGRFTSSQWLGVYSCVIPDEGNTNTTIHIGIYTSTPPVVSISSLKASSSPLFNTFVMNCTTTGSTATTVNWYKENQLVTAGFLYQFLQILRDGVTSTYDNLLLVFSPLVNVITGVYKCEVSNNVSTSASMTSTHIQGLTISDRGIYELGSSANLACSSDIGVSSIVWLYSGEVLQSTDGDEAVWTIDTVTDMDHNKEFICRADSRFGSQERVFRVQIEADAEDLRLVITQSPNEPVHNQRFSLTCTATKAAGLQNTPTVDWLDTMGNKLSGSALPRGVSIETNTTALQVLSTLVFSNLDATHSGEFTCVTEITTPALPGVITHSATWDLLVLVPVTQPPTTAAPPCSKMFQLLLSDVNDCQSYRFSDDPESRIASIKSSIVKSVNSIGFTACTVCSPLTPGQITNPTFRCDSRAPTSVLFRAKIEGNGTCSDILTVLKTWVQGGAATVTVNFNTLTISGDCPVEISSLNAQFPDHCGTGDGVTEQTGGSSLGLIVGGGAGGAVIIVLILVTLIVVCVIYLRRRKKKRYVPNNNLDNPGYLTNAFYNSTPLSENAYYYGQTVPSYAQGDLPAVPSYQEATRPDRDSTGSYITMRSAQKAAEYYDDVSCKKELGEELYAQIPGILPEEEYDDIKHGASLSVNIPQTFKSE